jgi:Asp/Glu/hydantoin racemase
MSGPIVIINPNGIQAVTTAIDASLEPLRISGAPRIVCQTLTEIRPPTEDQQDADAIMEPLCRSIAAQGDAGAFVIASFDDPGLHLARIATARPVLGSAECGILTALTLGSRFGVISLRANSVTRHLRYVTGMGISIRLAGDLPIERGAGEVLDVPTMLARMTKIGLRLRNEHGADVVVVGCVGMASYRDELEAALGIAVVEPIQAAVAMALGRAWLGWGTAVHYLSSLRSSPGSSSVSTR